MNISPSIQSYYISTRYLFSYFELVSNFRPRPFGPPWDSIGAFLADSPICSLRQETSNSINQPICFSSFWSQLHSLAWTLWPVSVNINSVLSRPLDRILQNAFPVNDRPSRFRTNPQTRMSFTMSGDATVYRDRKALVGWFSISI